MAHYFENDGKDETLFKFETEICGKTFEIFSSSGVFSKNEIDFGTKLLIESFITKVKDGIEFADLGCGYGIVGKTVLECFESTNVSFFDINEKAINLAKKNCGSEKRAKFFCADGTDAKNAFDMVALNPPFRAGNKVLFKLFENAYSALKKGGRFFVVLRKKQGAKTYALKIKQIFGNDETVLKQKKGYIVYEFCKK